MSEFDLPLVHNDDVVVRVVEYGRKPTIMTKARAGAVFAAPVIGEFMGQRRFGQVNLIVIDWSNALGLQPQEVAKPVMFLELQRFFPEKGNGGAWLRVEGRLDIDSVFEGGVVTRSLLEDLVNELGTTLASKYREGAK